MLPKNDPAVINIGTCMEIAISPNSRVLFVAFFVRPTSPPPVKSPWSSCAWCIPDISSQLGNPSVEPRSMFLPINFICNGSSISLHLIVFVCICCFNPDVPYWVLSPPIWFLTSKLIGLPYRRCWMVIPPSNPGRLLVNFPQSVTCYLVSLHISSKLKEECVFISLWMFQTIDRWRIVSLYIIYMAVCQNQ